MADGIITIDLISSELNIDDEKLAGIFDYLFQLASNTNNNAYYPKGKTLRLPSNKKLGKEIHFKHDVVIYYADRPTPNPRRILAFDKSTALDTNKGQFGCVVKAACKFTLTQEKKLQILHTNAAVKIIPYSLDKRLRYQSLAQMEYQAIKALNYASHYIETILCSIITLPYFPLPEIDIQSLQTNTSMTLRVLYLIGNIINEMLKIPRKLVHGDIKPANLLGSLETSESRIIDWGLSFFTWTLFTNLRGTPLYNAPEKYESYESSEINSKIDIFSLGVVIAQMLGSKIFDGSKLTMKTIVQYASNITEKTIEDAGLFSNLETQPPEEVKKSMLKLLSQMLNPKPENRPPLKKIKEDFASILLTTFNQSLYVIESYFFAITLDRNFQEWMKPSINKKNVGDFLSYLKEQAKTLDPHVDLWPEEAIKILQYQLNIRSLHSQTTIKGLISCSQYIMQSYLEIEEKLHALLKEILAVELTENTSKLIHYFCVSLARQYQPLTIDNVDKLKKQLAKDYDRLYTLWQAIRPDLPSSSFKNIEHQLLIINTAAAAISRLEKKPKTFAQPLETCLRDLLESDADKKLFYAAIDYPFQKNTDDFLKKVKGLTHKFSKLKEAMKEKYQEEFDPKKPDKGQSFRFFETGADLLRHRKGFFSWREAQSYIASIAPTYLKPS